MDNGTDRPEPRPDNRDKMGLPGGAVADSCDFQEGLSNGGLKALILARIGSLGLTGQFLLLAGLLFSVLAFGSGKIQSHAVLNQVIQGSLEIEQAMARGVLLPVLGDEPLRGYMSTSLQQRVHAEVTAKIDPDYISRIKVWGVDGTLVYNSDGGPVGQLSSLEPAVMRAVHGETVVLQTEDATGETLPNLNLGSVIFEVYMPLINSNGVVIGVGEIYCSIELIMARTARMLADTDGLRFLSLIFGLSGLLVLIAFAHRRMTNQEKSIAASLRKSENYAAHNKHLLAESERMRTEASRISEALLNRIGSDLHDGPIQLLTAYALYQGQLARHEAGLPLACKAGDCIDTAIAELRMISTGLQTSALEGLDLSEILILAVQKFQKESGTEAKLVMAEVMPPLPSETCAEIFKIVSEALHNARKHAGGRGVSVAASVEGQTLAVSISDTGPGMQNGQSSGAGVGLGLSCMRNRAKAIGAQLIIISDPGLGTVVRLTLPIHNGHKDGVQDH